ncbi:MAG: tetratricopeptide repeat protein [Saprospiraceae bacterium]|nr:tetratricopeptide repeat protein [Saprospiraceae bacterium]
MKILTNTESKGIEEDVLAKADSTIVKLYLSFKRTLAKKHFIEPVDDCAEFFYNQLKDHPQLVKLHSTMRRGYAVALQEDAQQVMNTMLKTGLTQQVLKGDSVEVIYKNYPTYIERAAQLLGEDHYMFKQLQARKLFFEGVMQSEKTKKRMAFYKALEWQTDMPHAIAYLIPSFESDQADSAIWCTNKAMELVPSWVEPNVSLARFYVSAKQFDKALEALDLAARVDSNSALIHYTRAGILFQQKDYVRAEKEFLNAIASTDDNVCFPCTHQGLGHLYNVLMQFDKAEASLWKALELDSTFHLALVNLGSVYGQQHQFDKAEEVLLKALKIKSKQVSVLINLANIFSMTGRLEKSVDYYKQALLIDSLHSSAYFGLGRLFQSQGEFVKAEYYYLKVLGIKPDDLDAMNGLGLVYQETGRKENALNQYKEILKQYPEYAPSWVNLGNMYFKSGELEKAKESYQNALKFPRSFAMPFALQGLGSIAMKTGHTQEAENYFVKSLESDQNFWYARLDLINLFFSQNKLEEAKIELDKGIKVNPLISNYYMLYAIHSWLTNKPLPPNDTAWAYLKQAFEKGYNDLATLNSDENLEIFRKDPRWGQYLDKYFPDHHKD